MCLCIFFSFMARNNDGFGDLDLNENNPGIEMNIKEESIVKEEPLDWTVSAISSTSS